MKVAIAGSSNFYPYELLSESIASSGFDVTEITSNGYDGLNEFAKKWADENNHPIHQFFADYQVFGDQHQAVCDKMLLENSNALIALWDGISEATKSTIKQAIELSLPVKVFLIVEDMIEEVRDFSPSENVIANALKHGIKVGV